MASSGQNETIEQGGLFGDTLVIEINRYERYIQSPQWKAQREAALARAKHCCQLCGVSKWSAQLEVHHLTYENLGNELPADLMVLCEKCHQGTHDRWSFFQSLREQRAYVEAHWKELNERAAALWGENWWMNESEISALEKLSSLFRR